MSKDILQDNKQNESQRKEIFCQEPSKKYLDKLEDAGGDPRVVAGEQALEDLKNTGSWTPTVDARDARVVLKED